MTGNEVRQAFLRFFQTKGHKVVPSSPLIPHGDPTLLLTSAGMVQFKPFFLGLETPHCPRMVSCQKCFRTTDIEAVGDTNHLTFFEMLGNFSVGDYFKEGAISLALEFVLEHLHIKNERLWITIFLDDDEAFEIWHRMGIPEARIIRFGEEDNFWGPAGDTGPCGPCSEIHYDFGAEIGCGKSSCGPNCRCGRFSEIWNLVFVQYNQDLQGRRIPLSCCHVDTGMGLERTAAVMQGKTSVYETDFFAPLIESISQLSGKNYGKDEDTDGYIRVVAEHGRGITFLVADGVSPDNEGRGYVLRRLLRRAAIFGRRLGLEKPFLSEIARKTIDVMSDNYPELNNRRDFIFKVIEREETRFGETLSTGLEQLDAIAVQASSRVRNVISGQQAFKLYDTYGFPVELTREIAEKQGLSVDVEGFAKAMDKQREKARASHRFEFDGKGIEKYKLGLESTAFVGYDNLKVKSVIQKILVNNKAVNSIIEKQNADIILSITPFYGEMGGQVGDSGKITSNSGCFTVSDAFQSPQGTIFHRGFVAEGRMSVNDEVEAVVDCEKRMDIARNHTATHLLHFALRRVLGKHVQQRGSLVAADRLRFDFSHLLALTEEELNKVQGIVNENIRQNLPVYDEDVPYNRAIEEGAIALFDEKYGDMVRVLKIGKPVVSTELCGGTHVTATGEIGLFRVLTESSIGGGLRRIEAVTGRGTEEMIKQKIDSLWDRLLAVQEELEAERQRTVQLERELAKKEATALLNRVEVVNGIKVLSESVPTTRPDMMREMSDMLRDKLQSVVVILGSIYQGKPAFIVAVTPDLVKRGYHAGQIVKKVAAIAGGSGGGKPDLAQGGGKASGKLGEALKVAKSLI
ncbi:MAG: alanine--tRNA ligase [Dehalococcoidia bacterium]|nr:MAG: alanine--tRNA ligase [Dehalococcoidia bacterium]